MKSELSMQPQNAKERSYPKLMVRMSDGLVVLFVDKREGFVICPSVTGYKIGMWFDSWKMQEFIDLDSEIKVILQNN